MRRRDFLKLTSFETGPFLEPNTTLPAREISLSVQVERRTPPYTSPRLNISAFLIDRVGFKTQVGAIGISTDDFKPGRFRELGTGCKNNNRGIIPGHKIPALQHKMPFILFFQADKTFLPDPGFQRVHHMKGSGRAVNEIQQGSPDFKMGLRFLFHKKIYIPRLIAVKKSVEEPRISQMVPVFCRFCSHITPILFDNPLKTKKLSGLQPPSPNLSGTICSTIIFNLSKMS